MAEKKIKKNEEIERMSEELRRLGKCRVFKDPDRVEFKRKMEQPQESDSSLSKVILYNHCKMQ